MASGKHKRLQDEKVEKKVVSKSNNSVNKIK